MLSAADGIHTYNLEEKFMKIKQVLKIMLIVALVIALLLGGGFTYLYFNGLSGMNKTTEAKDGQIKVACIGDSITYGHGITNWPKNNYPVLLQNLLGDEYHVNSYGVSGRAVQDNSDQPYRALPHYEESVAYDADIIVLMMGSNDTKPENWHGEEAFKAALIDLLDDYTQGEKKPAIYICTTPACFFMEDSEGELTSHDLRPAYADIIADIVRETAEELGYPVIDIHALTKENPQWFTKDGVHPNNDGAAAIAQAVYEAITGEK